MKNFISTNLSFLICLGLGIFLQSSCAQKGRKVSNSALTVVDSSDYFTNPVGKGADPWVVKDNGFYYVCQVAETKRGEGISIRKSSFLTKLGKRQVVWTAPKNAWNSTSVWAPELHHIGNRWYIYYTAGKSGPPYTFQRSGVLESVTDDPRGEYVDKGILKTGSDPADPSGVFWAIDLTVAEINGQLYGVWSGWDSNKKSDKTKQYLYIAKMSDPTTISSDRVKIASPDQPWETGGPLDLVEGAQFIFHKKDVFLIYSTRESWTPQYRLGQLRLKPKADPMKPESWIKSGPVFKGNESVLGVGHASFTKSPDDKEWWIFYHSKIDKKPGWDRNLRLQQFYWDKKGNPVFREPLPAEVKLKKPSGEK
jgi:GH43 family beta-xylosidase